MQRRIFVLAVWLFFLVSCNVKTSDEIPVVGKLSFIAAGSRHALVVDRGGNLYGAGSNDYYQLTKIEDGTLEGIGEVDLYTFTRISGVSGVEKACGGENFTIVFTEDGDIFAFGDNLYGQLGDGTTIRRESPIKISSSAHINPEKIACGNYHAVALSGGRVFAWGRNSEGELGNGNKNDSSTPLLVSSLINIVDVAAGGLYTLAVDTNGAIWAWGKNDHGQLGNGETRDSLIPSRVTGLDNYRAIKVAAGKQHSLAVFDSGIVAAWGYNFNGQIGDGSETDRHTPIIIDDIKDVTDVCAGEAHSVALKNDGTVWTWGGNQYGQLGIGSTDSYNTPQEVKFPEEGVSVKGIACGANFTMALDSKGYLWMWGRGEDGEIGNGETENTDAPIKVDIE